MKNNFIEVVKSLQLKNSNKEIVEKTKENKGNVSKYLNGKAEPSLPFLKRFANEFNIDINDLIPAITVGELKSHLSAFNDDDLVIFGDNDRTFYRTKSRGDGLVQIEFNENSEDNLGVGNEFNSSNLTLKVDELAKTLDIVLDVVERLSEELDEIKNNSGKSAERVTSPKAPKKDKVHNDK